MNDKELLELAAKAAGYAIELDMNWGTGGIPFFRLSGERWSPLTDDGDALRLAVKLGLRIEVHSARIEPFTRVVIDVTTDKEEEHRGNPDRATRRAIVRAAAEIGKSCLS